jgi:hypothetical protein
MSLLIMLLACGEKEAEDSAILDTAEQEDSANLKE